MNNNKLLLYIIPFLKKKNILLNRTYKLKINRLPLHELNIITHNVISKLPTVDLRNQFPAIYDQGTLGSCTANALCGLIGYDNKGFNGSRLFLYYNERVIENNILEDNGALLSDGIKSLQTNGICPENIWPYNINNFTIKPSVLCYTEALKHKAINVNHILNDMTSMKNSLINNNPFVVGIAVYESFETIRVSRTGIVPMPLSTEKLLGGHAVVCVGYDDTKQVWIMRNSWGVNWGDKGYFYLPYLYLLDSHLSSDLWIIKKIN